MDKMETNSDHEMKKREFANIHILKNVLGQLLFLEIVSVRKITNKLFICLCIKWWRGYLEMGTFHFFHFVRLSFVKDPFRSFLFCFNRLQKKIDFVHPQNYRSFSIYR